MVHGQGLGRMYDALPSLSASPALATMVRGPGLGRMCGAWFRQRFTLEDAIGPTPARVKLLHTRRQ